MSLWWTRDDEGGPVEDAFWRTSNSGGRATVRGRKGKKTAGHCGDIGATDGRGKPLTDLITFEAKRGRFSTSKGLQATMHDLLDYGPAQGRPQPYENFFTQAKEAAGRAGTPWWAVIHRRDNRRAMIFFPFGMWDSFDKLGYLVRDKENWSDCPFVTLVFFLRPGGRKAVVRGMLLERFFERVSPAAIQKDAKRASRRKPK